MKAISLHQPWATWVQIKWKLIETRTHNRFKSLKGQRIAIHAAKRIDEAAFFNEHFMEHIDSPVTVTNMIMAARLFGGKILCTAKVVDYRLAPNVGFEEREEWNTRAMCDVAGKYCLFLDEIEKLREPISFRGRQGIFEVPDELIMGGEQG